MTISTAAGTFVQQPDVKHGHSRFATKLLITMCIFLLVMNAFAGALPGDAPASVAIFSITVPIFSILVFIYLRHVPYPGFHIFVAISIIISMSMARTIYGLAFNVYYAGAFVFLLCSTYLLLNNYISTRALFRSVFIASSFILYYSVFDYSFVVERVGGRVRDTWGYPLFFDDKSHYTILLGFYLYVGANVLRRIWWDRAHGYTERTFWYSRLFPPFVIFSGLVALVMSGTTMSRLIIFFVPSLLFQMYYGVGCMFFLKKKHDAQRQLYLFYIFLFTFLLGFVVIGVVIGDAILNNPTAQRVLMVLDQQQDDSFKAHVLLIDYAVQMKLLNITNFIFGVGLGNYQAELLDSGLFLKLAPFAKLVQAAIKGYLPAHSVWASMFIEFNIAIYLAVICAILWLAVEALRRNALPTFLFIGGLVGSSTFYSTINEPFYFALWVVVIAGVVAAREASSAGGDIPGR